MDLQSMQNKIENWLLNTDDITKEEHDSYVRESRVYSYDDMASNHASAEGAPADDLKNYAVELVDHKIEISSVPATVYLCVSFVLLFAIQFFFVPFEPGSEQWLQVFAFSAENPTVSSLFLSLFGHGGLLHLVVNTIVIFSIGIVIEQSLSRKQFMGLFILSGIGAALLQGAFDLVIGMASTPSIGSSGGAFGLFGYLLRKKPGEKVLLFFIIPIKLWIAMALVVLGSIGLMVFVDTHAFGIAHMAHLGGMLVGIVISSIVSKPIPEKML